MTVHRWTPTGNAWFCGNCQHMNHWRRSACWKCSALMPRPQGVGLTALIDARMIAAGYDPECVTWVCEEHRRHCTVIQEPHEEHRCYWCDDPDEE